MLWEKNYTLHTVLTITKSFYICIEKTPRVMYPPPPPKKKYFYLSSKFFLNHPLITDGSWNSLRFRGNLWMGLLSVKLLKKKYFYLLKMAFNLEFFSELSKSTLVTWRNTMHSFKLVYTKMAQNSWSSQNSTLKNPWIINSFRFVNVQAPPTPRKKIFCFAVFMNFRFPNVSLISQTDVRPLEQTRH